MLHIVDLHKTFRTRDRAGATTVALDGIDLDVGEGSFTAILGPSGSGKTTLLRCIAGFERADRGTIELSGELLDSAGGRHVAPHARHIGIVPQEAALFPHLSVGQNIAFGLVGIDRRSKRERVEQLLELIDMPGMAERRPHQLSGGQQQRIALARALAPEPRLILLDEPFSALDAKLRGELREEIRSLLRDLGTTAILVTHDQDEALTLSDHLIVLRAGQVAADGAPHDLYDNPPDLGTAEFLGRANVLTGGLTPTTAREQPATTDAVPTAGCVLGEVPVRTWDGADSAEHAIDCELMIRPEHLSLSPIPSGAGAPGPGVGVVEKVSYHGPGAMVDVRLDADSVVTASVPGYRCPQLADRVHVQVSRPARAYPSDPG